MEYADPKKVLSPKRKIQEVKVILDTRVEGYSIALITQWTDDKKETYPAIGIRWNGGMKKDKNDNSVPNGGFPKSSAYPVWFVLPPDVAKSYVEHMLENQDNFKKASDEKGYEFNSSPIEEYLNHLKKQPSTVS